MNKQIIKIALIILAIIGFAACESSWGSCPSFKYEQDSFQSNDYLGKWYEIARHKGTPFQKGDCTTAEYSALENGNIKVVNSEYTNGVLTRAVGEAEKSEDQFRLKISFGKSLFSKFFKGDYRVVDTDYKNYTLVYSCTDFFFGNFYFVWVLAREPTLPEATVQKILAEIQAKFGVTKDELRFNNQSTELCGNRQ